MRIQLISPSLGRETAKVKTSLRFERAPKKEDRLFFFLLSGLVACFLQTFVLLISFVPLKTIDEGDWVYLPVHSSGTTKRGTGTLFKLQHLDIETDSQSIYDGFLRQFLGQRQEARHDAEILISAPNNNGMDIRFDILFSDYRGGFDLSNINNTSGSYVVPWESRHGATPLWIVTYGEEDVSMHVRYWQKTQKEKTVLDNSVPNSLDQRRQRATRIPPQEMQYPHRQPFARRRQQRQANDKVTLCTQLTMDRLPRLVALAKNFAGPISAVVYVGFRTGNIQQETDRAIQTWENSDAMQKHVDLHLVLDEKHPWYATGKTDAGHGLNPYPVNVLRQLAVEYAQTEWIMYLEADMITNPHAHDRIMDRWEAMMEHDNNRTAFVVPIYNVAVNDTSREQDNDLTSRVPPNKQALRTLVNSKEPNGFFRMGDVYTSHKDIDYSNWEQIDSGEFLPLDQKEEYFEPYFLVPKAFMPPYETLFWGMLNDKRQQVTDMLQCNWTFVHHPDLYAVHADSPGLGDGWIVLEQKTWRVMWAQQMHKLLTSENEMCRQ